MAMARSNVRSKRKSNHRVQTDQKELRGLISAESNDDPMPASHSEKFREVVMKCPRCGSILILVPLTAELPACEPPAMMHRSDSRKNHSQAQ